MDWDEVQNALEWYAAAPERWYNSAEEDLEAAAEWIWTVLEGGFADKQSTAQIVTGTVISIIPFVDQICDVRDLIACCYNLHEDDSDAWRWVALCLTLIGLFPELGSIAKGGGKILFAYGRKSVFRLGEELSTSNFWTISEPYVADGIAKLDQFLDMPAVRSTLHGLDIYKPYHFFSGKVDDVASALTASHLLNAFDSVIDVLRSLVTTIQKWGTAALASKAGELLQLVLAIRKKANNMLAKVLAPVNNWLTHLARRLELESDMQYRATVNALTPHTFKRVNNSEELAAIKANKPEWVDFRKNPKHPALKHSPTPPEDWVIKHGELPNIGDGSKHPLLQKKYNTFESAHPTQFQSGETIYRIVDPDSYDDSICWMRKKEFDALKTKADWRRRFAVWQSWNRNGEFVTYTVPKGKTLNAWEGPAASQQMENAPTVMLEGGSTQLVINPNDLIPEALGKRQATHWGYGKLDSEPDGKLGLPKLTNNVYSMQSNK